MVIRFKQEVSSTDFGGLEMDLSNNMTSQLAPKMKGFVINLYDDGKAAVMVVKNSQEAGCHCDESGCHCTGGGSDITLKANNGIGAKAGDLVALDFKPGAMTKSFALGLGIPLIGMALGAFIGIVMGQRIVLPLTGIVLVAGIGLILGILFSVYVYRRISGDLQPYIEHVLRQPSEAKPAVGTADPVCEKGIDAETAAAKMDYKGKTYLFCSSDCLNAFVRDPARYVGGQLGFLKGLPPLDTNPSSFDQFH